MGAVWCIRDQGIHCLASAWPCAYVCMGTAPAGYHGPLSWSVILHQTHRCWVHWSDFVGGQHLPATVLVRIGIYTAVHGTASVHWRGFAHMACMQCWHGGAIGFKTQQCQYVCVDQGSTLHTQHFYSLGTQHRLPCRLHDCNQTFHYCGTSIACIKVDA